MAIDASIIGGLKQFQPESPIDNYGKAMTLQNLMQKGQMDQITLQQHQQAQAEDNQMRGYVTQSGGDMQKLRDLTYGGGLYKQGQAQDKAMADQAKAKGELAKSTAQTSKLQGETLDMAIGRHRDELSNVNTYQGAVDWVRSGYANPDLKSITSRGNIDQSIAQIPQDPEGFANWKMQSGLSAEKLIKMTTPDANAVLSARTSTANNTATIANASNTAQMVDNRKRDELQGAQDAFTPGAITNAASRYNIDGTLPPMGMGKAGSAGRAAILNEAAVQANESGISGDDQRIAQIGNKANTAALSKIQQSQTMVGAFEKNFTRNADIALEESKKVDSTGVPLVNKWLNAGKRSIAGDAQLAAYDAVIKSTSNEYAKIVSGSMGNTALAEGEIKKIEGLLNSAQTPQQVEAVINMMKRETDNRMKGFEEEKALLRNSMKSTRASPTQESTQAPTGQQEGAVSKSKSGKDIVMRGGKWEYK